MRVTPLEIRQKTFEKNFRGYQIEEVNAFLQTLSHEWERIMDDNKELRIKLEATEREVTKLREVESSLYKTLKTAEDTGANVIEQARMAAELHLRESQLKAEAMLNEAKNKAKDTIEESDERAKEIVAEMEDRLRILVESYKKMESTREDLLADLKRLASDALEKVERAKQQSRDFNPDQHLAMAKRETKKLAFPNIDFERIRKPEPVAQKDVVLTAEPVFADTVQNKKPQKSFFDEIG
ncbi:MAG TPA: DivIVA domain-containing protein [Ohtaekwangia sp.]|nr:DivIVA domain-containing protein [Ohtaekwangia sp.]